MTIIEKQNLFNEAVSFYELAECGRKYIPEQKSVESQIPYIINLSFGAELLLKLLLIEEGKTIKEVEKLSHNLKLLYNELSSETKEQIYMQFKRPLVYKIDEEMERVNRAFVDWRYLVLNKSKGTFKKMQVHPYFLKELNEVLQEVTQLVISGSAFATSESEPPNQK